MESIEKLKSWESGRRTERAQFARSLVELLEVENKRGTLSLLDLRREFENRYDSRTPTIVRKFFRAIQPLILAAYLLPVAYTWFELQDVLGSFSLDTNLKEGTSLISYWSGGAGQFDGRTLQEVGLFLSVGIFIIFAVQLLADYFDQPPSELSAELNDALYAVQFDLAQTRVLTPQEFTETISAAASELESALTTITNTVTEASSMIQEVANTTSGLTSASQTLSSVSGQLRDAVTPIVNLESTLQKTDEAIQNSTASLREMHALVTNTFNHLQGVERQTSQVGQTSIEVSRAAEQLMHRVENAGHVLDASGQKFTSAVQLSSDITSRLNDLLNAFDERDTQFLSIQGISREMSTASANILRAVDEIKKASIEFVKVNAEIADAMKDNLGGK